MHTTKLKVQDFQTEGQTRKILAKVKKGWRVAKNCTNVPYSNTPRTLSLELMRAGQWDLAIDWVINLCDKHVTISLKFRLFRFLTRAFNNETKKGKFDGVSEKEYSTLLQSHTQHCIK